MRFLYTLRYSSELRDQRDYFREITDAEINQHSLELAETLIAKRAPKFDLSKFEDGYEIALRGIGQRQSQ